MPEFFLDTSTVLKRYVQETGTPWVQALAAPAAGHSLIIVRITLAETVAAITRRERGGTITPQDAATALTDFQLDFARQYFIIEVSAPLVDQAASLARKHGLRGYYPGKEESHTLARRANLEVAPSVLRPEGAATNQSQGTALGR